MTPEEKISALGISLAVPPAPLGAYIPVQRAGDLLFLSGILPLVDGKLLKTGRVGDQIPAEEGPMLARTVAINALSILKSHLGELGKIKRCVKITGYIASAAGFTGQAAVLNGASGLMVEVFGEAGRHARAAVGVSVLPLDSPIEVEFIFEAGE